MSEKQYIVFKLGNEEYGVDILVVKEIADYTKPTKVANSAPHVDGIINLRGDIVPIVNLRKKFKMSNTEIVENAKILYGNITDAAKDKIIGFIIDNTSEILYIKDQNITKTEEVLGKASDTFVHSIGKVDDRIICLLDLNELA